MNSQISPWDRQPDEPPAAYTRFLLYRGLGPNRSLEAAYAIHHGEAPQGEERRRVPGQWSRDASHFSWVARAHAWDAFSLAEAGEQVVIAFTALLGQIARKTLQALDKPDLQPSSMADVLHAIEVLGQFIPAECAGQIAQRHQRNGVGPRGVVG